MSDFKGSPTGRMMALSAGLILVGGGVAALTTGLVSLFAMGVPILLGISVMILAIPLGAERFPNEVTLALIISPFALFFYACLMGVVIHYAPAGGYAFVALGALNLAMAAFSSEKGKPAAAAAAH